jgi:hypothetical protein
MEGDCLLSYERAVPRGTGNEIRAIDGKLKPATEKFKSGQ